MKKVAVLIIVLIVNFSYSQITIINTGTTDNLLSISKINNNLLISGYNSFLVKSYDNCNTLIPVNIPAFPQSPQDRGYLITRVDTNVLYINYNDATNQCQIWKSSNGGNNWVNKIDISGFGSIYPNGYPMFFDTINGIITSYYNQVMLTTNSFNTYSITNYAPGNLLEPGTNAVLDDSVAIFTETSGGGAYITKNRGRTWQGAMVAGAVRDFEVVNKDTIYYVSNGAGANNNRYLGYTFDGGLNWNYKILDTPTSSGSPPNDLYLSMCVKSKNEIYILVRNGYVFLSGNYTGYGHILKSTDLGQTWTRMTTTFVEDLNDMKFLNDSIALVCGSRGLLYKWNTKTGLFVGVKENISDNETVKIYPNPANDFLNIDCGTFNDKNAKLEIINNLGQVVYQSTITNSQSKINIEQLSKGIYIVQIESETKIIGRSKLIKQ